MFRYTVRCEFSTTDTELIQRWLDWLRNGHIQDVLASGASTAEIVKMDAQQPVFEIRYCFESRARFSAYESDHAPRLREEGLAQFPLEQGLAYSRTTGVVIFEISQS